MTRRGALLLIRIAVALAACFGLVAVASAQQVLDFKPVPRESVSRFERMRIIRHGQTDEDSSQVVPPAPDVPEPPGHGGHRFGSITRLGADIHVDKDEVVHGDVSSVSGDITVDGHVEGDVVAMKGDVELASTARVDGDVVCLGGTLTEQPGAYVGGQRVTTGGSSWRRRLSDHESVAEHIHGGGDTVAGSLIWLLLMVLAAWLFVHFAPARTASAVETLRRTPGMSFGIGALVVVLIIPSIIALALVVALLCITIIGIPLALAALAGYALFMTILGTWGFVVGASVFGGGVARRSSSAHVHATGTPLAVPAGVAPTPAPAVIDVAPMRAALTGIGFLFGAVVLGHLIRAATGWGPLHAFGALFIVLGIIGSALATTAGAGAVLRSEIVHGTFERLMRGRNWRVNVHMPGRPAPGPEVTPPTMPGTGDVPPYAGSPPPGPSVPPAGAPPGMATPITPEAPPPSSVTPPYVPPAPERSPYAPPATPEQSPPAGPGEIPPPDAPLGAGGP